jgi:uncharacterized protein (DUF2141 family)
MKIKTFTRLILVTFLFTSGSIFSQQENITVSFTNMTPHLNQDLYLRVVDKSTLKETGRTVVPVSSADFNVTLTAVESGGSYFIDFFADHNGNGRYDSPPVDHTWRLELNNAAGNDIINFTHSTAFTDIAWQNILTIDFEGMTPHLGQMLEIKLENSTVEKEIDRIKIASIESASFSVQLVGLVDPGDYSIEFYADHNSNGLYDAPPVDHAWKIGFDYTGGNVHIDFTHNTNFSDVKWNYLLNVEFTGMTPHLGQLFELRVVKTENQEEVGRVTLPSVLVPDFTVYVPGFDLNKDYNIDFYADHNGNGSYNAPPADHAWRLNFNSSKGDFTSSFLHNTSFTDIQWPDVTSTDDDISTTYSFVLEQNYPNPFNPVTAISYEVPVKNHVILKVYDIIGNQVAVLVNKEQTAGAYNITWDASAMPSGVYFYRLNAGSFEQIRKMILMK